MFVLAHHSPEAFSAGFCVALILIVAALVASKILGGKGGK